MSFPKVNPSGWAANDPLTLVQINQLDADHSHSLDKSAAGDAILGVVVVDSGAGGQIQAVGNESIIATVAKGIAATAAGGIASATTGGFELAGGANDEVTYASPRTKVVASPCRPVNDVLASGWTVAVAIASLVGPATSSSVQALGPLPVHNGATLTNVRIHLTVGGPHSALPATMPRLQIYRQSIATGENVEIGGASAGAASPAGWEATTFWDVPVTIDNVIDRAQYTYSALLVDENGSGSVAGNAYHGMVCTFSNITTMAFA